MKDALKHWPELAQQLQPHDKVLWLFDFDGTLAPIASRPGKANMPGPVRKALLRVARRFRGHVGVVSGRALKHLMPKVGLPRLIYSGTHGFEIQSPRWHYKRPRAEALQKKLNAVVAPFERRIKAVPGFWVEKKPWSRCLHFRQTLQKDREKVRQILEDVTRQAKLNRLTPQVALQSLEILPGGGRDKGTAVRDIREKFKLKKVFYVGDDTTDESVFRAFKFPHVMVRVGAHSRSQAAWSLARQSEILPFLERIGLL